MKQVSISELQSNVALWIDQVAVERQIVILDQGQPVAALVPLSGLPGSSSLPNREERIRQRSSLSVDSTTYISEMRD